MLFLLNSIDGFATIRTNKRPGAGNGSTHETETAHKGYTPCLAYCIGKTNKPMPTLLCDCGAATRRKRRKHYEKNKAASQMAGPGAVPEYAGGRVPALRHDLRRRTGLQPRPRRRLRPCHGKACDTASFAYENAKTGTGRSVSVLIEDNDVLYYGRPAYCLKRQRLRRSRLHPAGRS